MVPTLRLQNAETSDPVQSRLVLERASVIGGAVCWIGLNARRTSTEMLQCFSQFGLAALSLAGSGHPVKKMFTVRFWRLVELKDPTVLNSKL